MLDPWDDIHPNARPERVFSALRESTGVDNALVSSDCRGYPCVLLVRDQGALLGEVHRALIDELEGVTVEISASISREYGREHTFWVMDPSSPADTLAAGLRRSFLRRELHGVGPIHR